MRAHLGPGEDLGGLLLGRVAPATHHLQLDLGARGRGQRPHHLGHRRTQENEDPDQRVPGQFGLSRSAALHCLSPSQSE